jgi:hypothetical protein
MIKFLLATAAAGFLCAAFLDPVGASGLVLFMAGETE